MVIYTTVLMLGGMEVYTRSDVPGAFFWCDKHNYNGRGPFQTRYLALDDYRSYLKAQKVAKLQGIPPEPLTNLFQLGKKPEVKIIEVDFNSKKRK